MLQSSSRTLFGRLFARGDTQQKMMPYWYGSLRAYVTPVGKPAWSARTYTKFADEAYRRNVVAHRAINLIARGAASVPLLVFTRSAKGERIELGAHPVKSLIESPSPVMNQAGFFEALYTYKLLSGNAYVQAIGPVGESPQELYLLRPDRMQVIAGKGGIPLGYRYTVGEAHTDFSVDRITGFSSILHLKEFHPTDDWYGLSSVEPAAYSIDQHNQASAWNQSLLQNGARPSGALVVRGGEGGGNLSEEQYWRLKNQISEEFSGSENAGKPILLEGGLDWKEMSLSPKDMDFMEAKHSAARDIALAFGVPPQLLGIPGDNTYSNLSEARLALWEQTILPLVDGTLGALSSWLSRYYGERIFLESDTDAISALAPRRDGIWERVKDAAFLSDEEKRAAVGYGKR
ncbi:MAG: phage portal protein [Rickettsiales bacterium]